MYKLFIVVELLMGEIPERSVFRQPVLKKALVPYLHIVQGEYRVLQRICENIRSLPPPRNDLPQLFASEILKLSQPH